MRVLSTREVERATPRTRIIRLDLSDQPFAFTAGQAVLVALHGAPLKKPYSIACSPKQALESHALELLVQVDAPPDADDPHLERLMPGSLVDVEGPMGTFGLPAEDAAKDLLFVAGGTGIAPLRSMLWDAIENRPDTRLTLIYSVRSGDEIAYEKEFRKLAEEGRVDFRVTITRSGPESWLGPRGRINEALIQHVIRTPNTHCIVCGPRGMITDVSSLLTAAGVPADLILTETFST